MRKNIMIFILILLLFPVLNLTGTTDFDKNFSNRTFRIDYYHSGNATEESFSIDNIFIEGEWAGSRKNLIFPFRYGRYKYEIYSVADNTLIFSKCFDSYFGEYRTTEKAIKGIKRTFHETALLPLPRKKIQFRILRKENNKKYREMFLAEIDPAGRNISSERKFGETKIIPLHKSGDPGKCVDIAIIAEGYKASEFKKANSDFIKVKKIFFSQEPYMSLKLKFNLYGLFKPSNDSGTDDSMNSPRYLLTESNKKLRNIASAVPYDALIIMVNSKRYGGGGIFNLYCTFTIDNEQTPYLLLHEFGHSFSGLADEYYSSAVSYNEFYPKGSEPDEPNITALLDRDNIKWKNLITKGVKIPTVWRKDEFDRMNSGFSDKRAKINAKIESLIKEGATLSSIQKARKELNTLINIKEKEDRIFFSSSKNLGIVGAFEGAGYSSKGLYRPMINCIMFTIGKKPYCTVCRSSVEKMIRYYTD